MNQKTAFEILKRGYNVFLTGAAGSGKTYLLNQFIKYLKSQKVNVAVTASTGIAATHMNGITIHSWSGLGVKENLTEADLKKIAGNSRLRNRISKAKVLIIDEISMLHARQLDEVDRILKKIKNPFLPFGGIRVVLSGDFFQLPPVSKNRAGKARQVYLSLIWRGADIKICYLGEQHRQKNDLLIGALNDIRQGKVSGRTRQLILSRKNREVSGITKPARLFTHNVDVDAINNLELQKIKEKPYSYSMQSRGKKQMVEILKQGCLAPEKLILKQGARVMFVKNNFEAGYVNGTLGEVIGFEEETKMPIVKILSGKDIMASPDEWQFEENGKIKASIRQVPLRLAWAITVHKSQGMTLDAAEIDLGKSFGYGMGYVALSRVRSLSGIKLLDFNEMALRIDPEISKLDNKLIRMSESLAGEFKKTNSFAVDRRENKAYGVEDIRKKYADAYAPWTAESDKKLLNEYKLGLSTSELSKIFKRQRGAIRSRLKKLNANGGSL